MSCKVLAVANMKGGVGKTTMVVCLAEGIAVEEPDAKVLVVDADPQASASVALIGDERLRALIEDGRTLDAFLDDYLRYPPVPVRNRLVDLVCRNWTTTTHNGVPLDISLLPCGPYLRFIEKQTVRDFAEHGLGPDAYEKRLWAMWGRELKAIREEFDYVICDCAPSLSVVNEMMIRSADLVVLPTIPDFISSYGLNAFLHSVWKFPIAGLPAPTRLPHVVISKYQSNVKQHRDSAAEIVKVADETAEYRVLETFVPNLTVFSTALSKGEDCPTFTNKYTSKAINEVIAPLVGEIMGVLNAHAT